MEPINSAASLYDAQAQFVQAYEARVRDLNNSIAGILNSAAENDGSIALEKAAGIQNQVQDDTLKVFVGNGQPYKANGVSPNSDYAKMLNTGIVDTSTGVVESHQEWIATNVDDRISAWLARPGSGRAVRGAIAEVFRPNPLAQYDPKRWWVDPRNGYTLSDQVWRTGLTTRERIGKEIVTALRSGTSAVELSKRLEHLLILPSKRTRKPYRTNLSYDAMRLARTEITAAHGRATMVAAQANPFVDGMDWMLSAMHPKQDECDDRATLQAGGTRIKAAYALGSAPGYPPHPHCLCVLLASVEDASAKADAIIRLVEQYREPPYTTVANGQFIELLIAKGA